CRALPRLRARGGDVGDSDLAATAEHHLVMSQAVEHFVCDDDRVRSARAHAAWSGQVHVVPGHAAGQSAELFGLAAPEGRALLDDAIAERTSEPLPQCVALGA